MEPESTGIGGDCFCLYTEGGSDRVVAMNGSGRAPAGLTAEWLLEQGISEIPQHSPHAVTMPTAIDAWVQLNRDYGAKPLGELLQPAIDYAENGFPIGQRVAADFASSRELLLRDPDMAALYLNEGENYQFGDRFANPRLGRTMREIAEKGRDGFYRGWVAEDILGKLNALGGVHCQADMDNAVAEYVEPIRTSFRGHDIWECPPNGQGIIALMLLNMASEIDRFGDHPISLQRMHHEIEAGKLAYRDRGLYVADPAFGEFRWTPCWRSNMPMRFGRRSIRRAPPRTCPNARCHRTRARCISRWSTRTATPAASSIRCFTISDREYPGPRERRESAESRAGVCRSAGAPELCRARQAPAHTIIPAMATKDGRTVMSFGVMGGEYQAFGHMQFLTRLFDYGMDVQEAQDTPRFFPNPFSDEVEVEEPISDELRDGLRALGHNIQPAKKPIGGSQAIFIDWDTGMLIAGSDPRKDGSAIGY